MPRKKLTGQEQYLTAEMFGELLFNLPVREVYHMIRENVIHGVVLYRESIHAIPRSELERLQKLLTDPTFPGIRAEKGGWLFRPIQAVQHDNSHLRQVTS